MEAKMRLKFVLTEVYIGNGTVQSLIPTSLIENLIENTKYFL